MFKDDYALVRAALDSDVQARHLVFLRSHPIITVVVTSLLRLADDRELTSDAIQHCHLALLTALPDFQGTSSLTTFVYTVAKNQTVNFWKKHRRGRTEQLGDDVPTHALFGPAHPSPEQQAIWRQQLQSFLDELLGPRSARDRLIFELRYHDGLSSKAIGQALGCSHETVDVVIFRIREDARRLKSVHFPHAPTETDPEPAEPKKGKSC